MRILIASSIDVDAIQHLGRNHEVVFAPGAGPDELLEKIECAEVIVFRSGVSLGPEVLAKARDLKLVVRAGSGLDNIDLAELRRRGIPLVRIQRPSAQAVAELTFAHMLGLSRNLIRADAAWREGRWVKNDYKNYLLAGKTLGIVGVGNIGQRVGELGRAWGMEVIGCIDPWSRKEAERLAAIGIEILTLEDVVPRADFLTLHVPLSDSTRYLIDAEVLGRMKVGSYLVNMARGGVVDEAALREALTSGERLRGAALDVHENEGDGSLSPLRDLSNVILTPHVGSSTVDTQREIGLEMIEIIEQFAENRQNEDRTAEATNTASLTA